MFYLRVFIQTLLQSKLASALLLLSLGGVFGTLTFKNDFERLVLSQKGQEAENPYFYAVIPEDKNVSYLRRKLMELPGVKKVSMMDEGKITEHVKAVLESTQVSFDESLLDLRYSGMKVGLSPDLKPRSLNLIRSYIKRLAGEKEVTLGAVKRPEISKGKAPLKLVFMKTTQWAPMAFLGLYLVALFFISQTLRKESWLIETYQRKSNVYEKSLSYSQAPLLVGLVVMTVTKGAAVAPLLLGLVLGLTAILMIGKRRVAF